MKAVRYLVLIHLAAKTTRSDLADVAIRIKHSIEANLQNSEPVCTSQTSLAFVGEATVSSERLFGFLADTLSSGDNLSVFTLDGSIATSHAGLNGWCRRMNF